MDARSTGDNPSGLGALAGMSANPAASPAEQATPKNWGKSW